MRPPSVGAARETAFGVVTAAEVVRSPTCSRLLAPKHRSAPEADSRHTSAGATINRRDRRPRRCAQRATRTTRSPSRAPRIRSPLWQRALAVVLNRAGVVAPATTCAERPGGWATAPKVPQHARRPASVRMQTWRSPTASCRDEARGVRGSDVTAGRPREDLARRVVAPARDLAARRAGASRTSGRRRPHGLATITGWSDTSTGRATRS